MIKLFIALALVTIGLILSTATVAIVTYISPVHLHYVPWIMILGFVIYIVGLCYGIVNLDSSD